MSVVKEVTDQNFHAEVLASDVPVLVDFTASWCGPCKALGPVLEDIAQSRSDIKIVKIDVGGDKETHTPTNPETGKNYQIASFPTLYLFRGGKIADVKLGGGCKDELTKWIDDALARSPEADMDQSQALAKIEEEKKKFDEAFAKVMIPAIGAFAVYKLAKFGGGATLVAEGIMSGQPIHTAVGVAAAAFSSLDIAYSIKLKSWSGRLTGMFKHAAEYTESGTMLANGLMLSHLADTMPGLVSYSTVKALAVASLISGTVRPMGLVTGLLAKVFAGHAPKTPVQADASPEETKDPAQPVCKDGVCKLPPPRPE